MSKNKGKHEAPGKPGADDKDPMASAVGAADTGKPGAEIEQAAKDAEARRLQDEVERKARETASAISDDQRATLDRVSREQKEREQLRPAAPIIAATSASAARPGENTVTMIFPRAMFIWAEPDATHPSRYKVEFKAGAQQVPESLAGHWYLAASGVKLYDAGKQP